MFLALKAGMAWKQKRLPMASCRATSIPIAKVNYHSVHYGVVAIARWDRVQKNMVSATHVTREKMISSRAQIAKKVIGETNATRGAKRACIAQITNVIRKTLVNVLRAFFA